MADTPCSCSCPLSGSERHTTASHNALPFHLIFDACQHIAHRSSRHTMLYQQCNAHDVLRSTAQKDTILESMYVRHCDCSERVSGLCRVLWVSSHYFWYVLYSTYGQRARLFIRGGDRTRRSTLGHSRAVRTTVNIAHYM